MLTVRDVMTKKVVKVRADQTVREAAESMNKHHVGCLVVLEKGKVEGIVTERDMLGRVVATSANPEKIKVREVMSKPVFTVKPDTPLEEAVELMFAHGIKKLPVVEGSDEGLRMVGIVTLTDIARLQPALIMTLKKLYDVSGEDPPKNVEKVMNFYVV
jgi:CBS domain-containing protein